MREAFGRLSTGQTPAADHRDFDHLSHALGVSCVRAVQIAGESKEANTMLPPLQAGNQVLRGVLARRRKWGKWEFLAQEVAALDWAIEIYETIVLASSPAQMTNAMDLRDRAFRGAMQEAL